MRGLILTAKHHDGFCLWPSRFTEHSVKNSPWRGGKGDVVREISEACRRRGLKFGVYLSPWDRNHADYGRPEYVDYYRNQLRELLTDYGPLFEVWFDGANGGDGYYGGARETRRIDRRTYYDWPNTWEIVRELQPGAVDVQRRRAGRALGGQRARASPATPAGPRCDRADFAPGEADAARLNRGDRPGTHWVPAECDVSIRPGWFYHACRGRPGEDVARAPRPLLRLGRPRSVAPAEPAARPAGSHPRERRAGAPRLPPGARPDLLRGPRPGSRTSASNVRGADPRFAAAMATDGRRDTYWSTDDGVTTPTLELDLGRDVSFNVVRLREHLPLGQRVEGWALDAWQAGAWTEVARGESIGNRRLWRGPTVTTRRVRLRITKSAACPALAELSLHLAPAEAR